MLPNWRRLALSLLVLSLVCGTRTAGAAEFNLRFGSINTAGTQAYDGGLMPFVKAVQDGAGGRVAIDLKPLGGYGRPTELFGLVESGRIELAATVQGYSPGRFPRSSVMELPMIFKDAESGTKAMWKMFAEDLIAEDYSSVKVLALYVLPPYGFFTVDKPINTVRDLRGMRIRAPSATYGLAMAKLGIVPLGLPINLIGETLANDAVDGIAYGWDSLRTTAGEGGPLVEQVREMLDVNFAAPALMVVMNKRYYEKLPEDIRKLVDQNSGLEFSLRSARIRDAAELVAKKAISENRSYRVTKFNDKETAELQRRIQPVYQQWQQSMANLNIDGDRLLTRVRSFVEQN
jgi:TRAP-type C4-dicarboxylate transport system substrate-binding protein